MSDLGKIHYSLLNEVIELDGKTKAM